MKTPKNMERVLIVDNDGIPSLAFYKDGLFEIEGSPDKEFLRHGQIDSWATMGEVKGFMATKDIYGAAYDDYVPLLSNNSDKVTFNLDMETKKVSSCFCKAYKAITFNMPDGKYALPFNDIAKCQVDYYYKAFGMETGTEEYFWELERIMDEDGELIDWLMDHTLFNDWSDIAIRIYEESDTTKSESDFWGDRSNFQIEYVNYE